MAFCLEAFAGNGEMELPGLRWHAAIGCRRSRRRYNQSELNSNELDRIQAVCAGFRPFPQARAELITHSVDRILTGLVGRYGKVTGATALVAFIGMMHDPNVYEKIGYTGEGVVLEATAMGLETCWVAGFFHPDVAARLFGVSPDERVVAVTPVGHALRDVTLEERAMTGFGRTHRRKPLSELVTGISSGEWPPWMKSALEAARLAPSAINRQPWRFHLKPCSIMVSVDSPRFTFGISKRLDCGIAILHIEVAAVASGVKGTWEFLKPPDVARFNISGHSR